MTPATSNHVVQRTCIAVGLRRSVSDTLATDHVSGTWRIHGSICVATSAGILQIERLARSLHDGIS